MSFTVASFLFFILPLCVLGYYIVNLLKKPILNNIYLILVSLYFYANFSFKATINLVIFSVVIFVMGKTLEKIKKSSYRTRIFSLYIIIVVLILCYYKYIFFVIELFYSINIEYFTISSVLVPLGMSFIMFEAISYLVDVYKQDVKAGNIVDVLLFFTFFPKITSGPIVLWKDFSPQIRNRLVSVDLFFSGLEKIMIGYAKKVIIADSLGVTVANITTNSTNGIDSITAILGMLCYFLQIYFDFSGYSDIAIGISRLFGFNFKENFNFPYTAISLSEFWRRWHISLGTWFRNYIYIPLGGNRKNVYINLFIVFMITGIWHGSTLNFVFWGFAHAIFIVAERYCKSKNFYNKIPKLIRWFVLMIFISFTWIIFMIPDFQEALIYYKSILGMPAGNIYFTYEYYFNNKILFIMVIGFIGAFIGKNQFLQNNLKKWSEESLAFIILKQIIYLILFILTVLFMINSSYSPFLYFQF